MKMNKWISERASRKVLKLLNPKREVSPKATEKFSEIGSLILEEFAECVEGIMNASGEKTRVMPRHIEQAHSRFMRDRNDNNE